jgi:hypothetical protein
VLLLSILPEAHTLVLPDGVVWFPFSFPFRSTPQVPGTDPRVNV